MMNPIRNIERSLGPGGPRLGGGLRRPSFSAMRHEKHNYPVRRTTVVIGVPHMQEGGEVPEQAHDFADLREPPENLSPHDAGMQQTVVEAMMALRGEHPDPERAVRKFIETFGEDEFAELRRMVLAQPRAGDGEEEEEAEEGERPDEESDEDAETERPAEPAQAGPSGGSYQVGGLLRGPGTGQSDEIEAVTPGGRKVLLSDGEYVIDAPTVAALGDGSTSSGARRLDNFRQEVRRQAYGHDKQAKMMRKGGRALLMALTR